MRYPARSGARAALVPLSLLALLLTPSLVGCSSGPGPDVVVREVFVGLSNYASHPREGTLAAVYQRLSSDTRAILDQRAKSASELGGREVKAWELLSFSKLVTGDRVTKISVLDEQGDRARVEVKFGWLMPSEEGAERLLPEPVQVDVVREDGAWRVTLPLADSSVKVEDAPPTSP